MPSYSPALVWFGQTKYTRASCQSCEWMDETSSLAACRAHILAHSGHVLIMTTVVSTRLGRPHAREAHDVAA